MKPSVYVFIILVFSTLWSCSPKILVGAYSAYTDNETHPVETTIHILPEKKIQISRLNDQGEFYGEGTYQIRGNQLVVNFEEVKTVRGEYEFSELEVNYVDAFMYKIIAQASQDLFGAIVYVIDRQGHLVKDNTIKHNGVSVLKVPKSAIIDHISVSAPGYYPLEIPISEPGSKNIEIYLEKDQKKYIPEGTLEIYDIESLGKTISFLKDGIKYNYKGNLE